GLLAIVILQNGLRLSSQPAELTGILTGALLLTTILLDRALMRSRARSPAVTSAEETEVKNSQVAVLCAVILFGAFLVAGTNLYLAQTMMRRTSSDFGGGGVARPDRKPVVAMMPKAKGDPYFISCREGAEEAASE